MSYMPNHLLLIPGFLTEMELKSTDLGIWRMQAGLQETDKCEALSLIGASSPHETPAVGLERQQKEVFSYLELPETHGSQAASRAGH